MNLQRYTPPLTLGGFGAVGPLVEKLVARGDIKEIDRTTTVPARFRPVIPGVRPAILVPGVAPERIAPVPTAPRMATILPGVFPTSDSEAPKKTGFLPGGTYSSFGALGVELLPVVTEKELKKRFARWYEKWWVWTLVGVGVVGAGGTTYYLIRRRKR